ncbi:MAG: AAA family ATPase, partial [Actinobacteria bacterium]|nr:AAA family ATPase [Actinomycetota bacterium]
GAQAAVAAALGDISDAVVVRGVDSAVSSLVLLKEQDAGRAALVIADMPTGASDSADTRLPDSGANVTGGRWLRDTVHCDDAIRPVVDRLLARCVLVGELSDVSRAQQERPDLVFVTESGDIFAGAVVHGGSTSAPSLLEVKAAYDETEASLEAVTHAVERSRFDLAAAKETQRQAAERVENALTRLHESDARMAAVAEQLGQLGQIARAATAEAERLGLALASAKAARETDETAVADLQQRLDQAQVEPEAGELHDLRVELAGVARESRQREVDARLALRTGEERVAAVGIRAEQLERAAKAERQARVAAVERRERRARELVVAQAVLIASKVALSRIEESVADASHARLEVERITKDRDASLVVVRGRIRELSAELDLLKDSVHRDEVARAEQRMRIEQVQDKVLEDFGIDSRVLIAEYGPDQPVPPSPVAPGDEIPADAPEPAPYPYVRAEQVKRLKEAEKGLALLGRVNPLALEEFTAMEERHTFLSEQLDDLRRSRDDLMDIVKEVDGRVEQVFTEAYRDIEREFSGVFSRLFPGGEGRLILTNPSDMLNTGVDVEARPPGKKVKRLSLLSGGERSLTAVAFLVALFKARPSPFYVLDEVEAALDDVNLGRLIDIIEELRSSSQLIVITHQKRTMEIADALYGVSMRGDGVTQVIGQRLREAATA